jgi:hypothetical protein
VSYRTWSACLTRFAEGDDAVLAEMAVLEVDWEPGVAERFTARVAQAFQRRLEELQRRLQRDLDAGLGDIAGVGQSLTRARAQLQPVVQLSRLPSLPDPVRSLLHDELTRILTDMDEALEHSIDARNQTGIELLAQVRQNRMVAALTTDAQNDAPATASTGSGTSRRAIIF